LLSSGGGLIGKHSRRKKYQKIFPREKRSSAENCG
jgi:hypothetical protein